MVSQTPPAASIPLVPASGNPDPDGRLDSRLRLDSQHKRVHARLDALCAGMSGGPRPRSFRANSQKIRVASVVFPVLAGLGHG
jgi:hypothetical protein